MGRAGAGVGGVAWGGWPGCFCGEVGAESATNFRMALAHDLEQVYY